MESHDILDVIGESMTTQVGHEGDKPTFVISDELTDFALEDPVKGWLVNASKISDDGIRVATDRLLNEVRSQATLEKYAHALKDVGIEDSTDDYNSLIESLCLKIQADLKDNNGKKFRTIIRNTDFYELNEILGNEDLREWLKTRPGGANTYDIEEAVVKATILSMAPKGLEVIRSWESEDKGINFSEN